MSSHILTELAEMCDTVGIIERGQLLAVGTVDEIQGKNEPVPQRFVTAEVLEGADRLAQWLAERDGLTQLAVDGDLVRFVHGASREAEAELLQAIVQAGFPVVSFATRRQSLEDVFMKVTEGRVQ